MFESDAREDYARVHKWPPVTAASMHGVVGAKEAKPPDSGATYAKGAVGYP